MQWILLPAFLAGIALALPSSMHGSGLEERDTPVWAANFATATDSTGAGFKRIQYQYEGGSVLNYDPGVTGGANMAIPIVNHAILGRALKIHLNASDASQNLPAMMRWEAAPGGPNSFGEGDDYYFRVDFVLDSDYPIAQTKAWNLVNQVHQASGSGSPPVEFDVHSSQIYAHGEGPSGATYDQALTAAAANTKYKLVYHVKFASAAANSSVEAWINDQHVLPAFTPPVPTLNGGNSYWKGATAYCKPGLAPFTVYQNNHRYGTTYASVN